VASGVVSDEIQRFGRNELTRLGAFSATLAPADVDPFEAASLAPCRRSVTNSVDISRGWGASATTGEGPTKTGLPAD
jgi:hypothetical protein